MFIEQSYIYIYITSIVFDCTRSEPQARRVASEGCVPEGMENAGDILNNKGTMEYTQGQMSITFRNMQLKKIKRADRKGQEVSYYLP